MRYPTKALLRCRRRSTPGTCFWLPDLTPEEAWWLTEFLDDFQEAIWMDHGDQIMAHQNALDFPDLHPPPESWTEARAPAAAPDPMDDTPF